MVKITANNGSENYFIEIQSPTANTIVADEPVEKGAAINGLTVLRYTFIFNT